MKEAGLGEGRSSPDALTADGAESGQLPSKAVWKFLKKRNAALPESPAIPLLGIYLPKRDEKLAIKSLHKNVYSGFVHRNQTLELSPGVRHINNLVAHPHNGTRLAIGAKYRTSKTAE